MSIKPIRTKKDFREAMARLEKIFDAEPGTKNGDELEVLTILIDSYEKEHYPIDYPDPVEAIIFRMDQLNMKQKDLIDAMGHKSRISEILNRKRKLTLEMVRRLSEILSIPTEVLVRAY